MDDQAIHVMRFYRVRFGYKPGDLPVCEDVAARSLALPFFAEMQEWQVRYVADELYGRWGGRRRGGVSGRTGVPGRRARVARRVWEGASRGRGWRARRKGSVLVGRGGRGEGVL